MQFRAQRKVGSPEFIAKYENRLEKAINKESRKFREQNELKKKRSNRIWAYVGLGIGATATVGAATVIVVAVGTVGGFSAGMVAAGCAAMAIGMATCCATQRLFAWTFSNSNIKETKKMK